MRIGFVTPESVGFETHWINPETRSPSILWTWFPQLEHEAVEKDSRAGATETRSHSVPLAQLRRTCELRLFIRPIWNILSDLIDHEAKHLSRHRPEPLDARRPDPQPARRARRNLSP